MTIVTYIVYFLQLFFQENNMTSDTELLQNALCKIVKMQISSAARKKEAQKKQLIALSQGHEKYHKLALSHQS